MTLLDAEAGDDALRHSRRAAQLAPEDHEVRNGYALAVVVAKDYEEAERQLRHALGQAPAYADARNNLINLLVLQERFEAAEAEAREVIRCQPEELGAVESLVRILEAQEKYDSALAEIDRGLSLQPESWDIKLSKSATLIDCLDLVITTSNVTAHLAGALGMETWLILQRAPLWYRGHQGNDTILTRRSGHFVKPLPIPGRTSYWPSSPRSMTASSFRN